MSANNSNTEEPVIKQIPQAELDAMLSMVSPDENNEPNNLLSNRQQQTTSGNLNDEEEEEEEEEDNIDDAAKKKAELEAAALAAKNTKAPDLIDQEDLEGKEQGAIKIKGLHSVVSKLIKDKVLFPFEGVKLVEEYTREEIEELIKVNIEERVLEATEKSPKEFFESLPEKLQYAAAFVQNNGSEKDLTLLFKYLGEAEEASNIDIKTQAGQEHVIRSWLHETGIGTPEEIEQEIIDIRDRKETEKKAQQFQPKLEAAKEDKAAKMVDAQAKRNKLIQKQTIEYRENVLKAVQTNDLNGIKIDNDEKALIFNGLTQNTYKLAGGQPTSMLGALLEKYTRVEPNFALIGEVLLLLNDQKTYHEKIKKMGAEGQVSGTVRKLKTAASQTTSAGQETIKIDNSSPRKTVQRRNIFETS